MHIKGQQILKRDEAATDQDICEGGDGVELAAVRERFGVVVAHISAANIPTTTAANETEGEMIRYRSRTVADQEAYRESPKHGQTNPALVTFRFLFGWRNPGME